MNTEFGYLPVGADLILYYVAISIIGILFFVYIRKDKFSILLFLIFFNGVSDALGDLIGNSFKIFFLLLTVLLFLDTKGKLYIDIKIVIIFILFSITFWISIYSNQNPFFFSFSQYSKFLIPFLVFMFLINNMINLQSNEYYLRLVVKLILLQVLFSVIKFFTIGFSESVVGSVAFMGGNSATILPILGYMIIYFLSNGKIKKIEIIQIASMLLISIMSFKRMIWFLFPIVILALNSISVSTKYLKYAIISIPLILYIGIRLNPTLNKEQKIWGSFDLGYVIDYSKDYYGLENAKPGRDKSFGRLAGNAYMIKYIGANLNNYKTWFGFGPKTIYGVSYKEYEKKDIKWGVADKGSLTGAARFLIAYGLVGMFLYLLLIISFFYKIDNKKFRLFLIILFLLEFFFYLDSFIYLPIIISIFLLLNYLSTKSIVLLKENTPTDYLKRKIFYNSTSNGEA